MEILPKEVFRCLAKELIREKKRQSYCYNHLYRQGMFLVPVLGTATAEERLQLKGYRRLLYREALKFASYTVAELIKSHSPLKTLGTLYI